MTSETTKKLRICFIYKSDVDKVNVLKNSPETTEKEPPDKLRKEGIATTKPTASYAGITDVP